jgi:hypothetical protein
MAQYQQKTESRVFEAASHDGRSGPTNGYPVPETTDIAIRLWDPQRSDRSGAFNWESDSVLVYMIADLVSASGGHISEESPAVMTAHFDGCAAALVAAKRIQTSMLEFLNCRPGECLGAAILIYQPMADDQDFSAEMVRRGLAQARPGRILITEDASYRLRDLPGIEFQSIPTLTTGVGSTTRLLELVWTPPVQLVRSEVAVGNPDAGKTDESPVVGATMIVNSPTRGAVAATTSTALPSVVETGELATKSASATALQRATPPSTQPEDRAPIRTDSGEGADSPILGGGLDDLGQRPFLTRTRVILGAAALVLVVALIKVIDRPRPALKLPLSPQSEQIGLREQETDGKAGQTNSNDASTGGAQSAKGTTTGDNRGSAGMAGSQGTSQSTADGRSTVSSRAQADKRPKVKKENASQKDSDQTTPVLDSGGMTQKDIPMLLKMAQQDAGAGNYDKARSEFRKILQLQPNNLDAKEGLHKIDLIRGR